MYVFDYVCFRRLLFNSILWEEISFICMQYLESITLYRNQAGISFKCVWNLAEVSHYYFCDRWTLQDILQFISSSPTYEWKSKRAISLCLRRRYFLSTRFRHPNAIVGRPRKQIKDSCRKSMHHLDVIESTFIESWYATFEKNKYGDVLR